MNIFSRIENGIASAVSRWQLKRSEKEQAKQEAPVQAQRHMIRIRTTTGRPVFGPAFLPPTENHHVSRQTCRATLRAIQFHNVSQKMLPGMSRHDRRRLARLFACLEYRRMMQDTTNAVDPETEALYRRMTKLQLEAA